jgi:hypothetical protein
MDSHDKDHCEADDHEDYDFVKWFCNDPLANLVLKLQNQSMTAPVPRPTTVQYIVNYSELPSVFYTFPVNVPPNSPQPTNLKSFFLQHNIYNPNTYNCTLAAAGANDSISIGQSYYTGNLTFVSGTTYEGPYNATNLFTLNGVIYTIYKTGILQQVYTNNTSTGFPTSTTIVTENVTGIDLQFSNGKNLISNAVDISNQTIFCGGSNPFASAGNTTGNTYTLYSIQYEPASLRDRPPPPPR